MELTLLLIVALALAAAVAALPRPDARRIPAEDHGRAREDGPVITVIDHREEERGVTRWLLPALATLAAVVAGIVAIVVGADL